MEMALLILYIIVGLIAAFIGTICGYYGRKHWHQLIPLHDPWYMLGVYPAEIIFCILVDTGIFQIGDNGGLVAVIFMPFDTFYILGYVLCKPNDMTPVNTPDMQNLDGSIWQMVHYLKPFENRYEDGTIEIVNKEYFMPQTLKGALRLWLGAPDPLLADWWNVKITRTYKHKKTIRKVETKGIVDVSQYIMTGSEVAKFKIWTRKMKDANKVVIAREPVYLLHMKVVTHKLIFPQTINQLPDMIFWTVEAYNHCISEMDEISADNRRLQVLMETMTNDAGRSFIKMMMDSREDGMGVFEELEETITKETELRRPSVKEEPANAAREGYDGPQIS